MTPRASLDSDAQPQPVNMVPCDQVFAAVRSTVVRLARANFTLLDAEDILQATAITIIRRRQAVPTAKSSWQPWARTVAQHHGLHLRRDYARRSQIAEQLISMNERETSNLAVDPARLTVARLDALTFFQSLPRQDRELIILKAWFGLGRRAVASRLGITVAAYDSRLRRLRRQIAGVLD